MSNMTTMAGNDSDDNFGTSQYMPTFPSVTEPFSPSSIYVKTPDIQYWICTVVLTAVGIVGNAMAFALMGDVKFSSLSYPVYLRFLAVADSTVLLSFCTYQSLRFFHSFYIISMYVAVCRVWMFCMFTVMLLSPWLVVGLTVDRFFCVAFPLKLNRFCT
ncbi:uncharacterized protein LOC121392689 [Gigantopelta aegis]|uniref:uncharacterized protein LOC121392689 n=1 Tax=Gigantopelta aegis TaxID=1735272 RepID=UPI001B88874A|nr:uncharacterized protein LOC121392689 [Gigantopelta aegis]